MMTLVTTGEMTFQIDLDQSPRWNLKLRWRRQNWKEPASLTGTPLRLMSSGSLLQSRNATTDHSPFSPRKRFYFIALYGAF
jgi:hypothetical protein